MKLLFFLYLFVCAFAAKAQQTNQDCTEESVLREPGRFLDAHVGGAIGGGRDGWNTLQITNAKKTLNSIEAIIKPNLVFTGGQAKASFSLNSIDHYNQISINSCTYNLGFHMFVCNVQTHKLAIVTEYTDVLRVTTNPYFFRAFNFLNFNAPEFRNPINSNNHLAANINIFSYYGFSDEKVVNAINNGNDFLDISDENITNNILFVENKPAKGYGFVIGNNFEKAVGTSYVYRHRYITHTDLPFFIPISRKQFLNDLLEYYEREKPYLLTETPNAKDEIIEINEKKKAYVLGLLNSKDSKWLNEPAAIEKENKSFSTYDQISKRNKESIWGRFYFTEFYNGNEGINLYCINPEYLKKFPPSSGKPSIIKVMYRFRATEAFGNKVNEDVIKTLDMEEFRKLL